MIPRRYWYPRFVGGPRAKKKAPYPPSHMQHVQIAGRTTVPWVAENAPPPTISFDTHVYSRCLVSIGRNRRLEFLAHESLTGEEAAEQLFTDMLSRCGAKEIRP